MLEFEQRYRAFNADETIVEVSGDGGIKRFLIRCIIIITKNIIKLQFKGLNKRKPRVNILK